MKAELLNAFLEAASHTLLKETQAPIRRLGLQMDPSEQLSDEVTIYVAFVGQVRGMVLIGLSTRVARDIASHMIGEPQPTLSELGLSALAELANLIAGRATIELEKLNLFSDITPPTLMIGHRSRVSTLGLPRFVIPLETVYGHVNINVAVDTGGR